MSTEKSSNPSRLPVAEHDIRVGRAPMDFGVARNTCNAGGPPHEGRFEIECRYTGGGFLQTNVQTYCLLHLVQLRNAIQQELDMLSGLQRER